MAYRIFTTDRTFIASRAELPKGTDRAYLVEYQLKSPPGSDPAKNAEWLAVATGRDIVDRLKMTEVQKYSAESGDAKEFPNEGRAKIAKEFIQKFQSEPRASNLEIELII